MEAYLQLLRQQIEKNRLINKLARRGRDAITAGDLVPLIEGDALRKQIMLQIQSLQSEMESCLTIPPHVCDHRPDSLQDDIRAAHSELQAIVSETLAIDKQNRSRIQKIRTTVREKLEDIGKGKRALSGYKSPAIKEAKLFDGQG